jgi:hypothetical protein
MAPAPSKLENDNENKSSEQPTDEDKDDEFDHIPDERLRAFLYLLRVQGLFMQLFYRFHELERQETAPLTANTTRTPAETVAPVNQTPTVSMPPTGSPAADRIRLRSREVEMKWKLAHKE